jgi:hypothetical protein
MLILLLGALAPKTEEGTIVGITIAPAVVAAAFFRNILLFMIVILLTDDRRRVTEEG